MSEVSVKARGASSQLLFGASSSSLSASFSKAAPVPQPFARYGLCINTVSLAITCNRRGCPPRRRLSWVYSERVILARGRHRDGRGAILQIPLAKAAVRRRLHSRADNLS